MEYNNFRVCPECGGKVANSIDTCIHCGHKFISEPDTPDVLNEHEKEQLRIFDYSVSPGGFVVINKLKDNYATDVIIPDCVSVIAAGAFYKSGIRSITSIGKLNSIGEQAFANCYNLEFVKIISSDNILNVKQCAFKGNDVLKELNISVKRCVIDEEGISRCAKLSNLSINSGAVSYIGQNLTECVSLIKLDISNADISNTKYFASKCFALSKIILPTEIKEIPCGFCCQCKSLEEIDLPITTRILDGAFSGCSKLRSVRYKGNNVGCIGEYCFSNCSELEICEPLNKAKEVKREAFNDCTKLKSAPNKSCLVDPKALRNTKCEKKMILQLRNYYVAQELENDKKYGWKLMKSENGNAYFLTSNIVKKTPFWNNQKSRYERVDEYLYDNLNWNGNDFEKHHSLINSKACSFNRFLVYPNCTIDIMSDSGRYDGPGYIPCKWELEKINQDERIAYNENGEKCEYLLSDLYYNSRSTQKETVDYDDGWPIKAFYTDSVHYKNIVITKVDKNGNIVEEPLDGSPIGIRLALKVSHTVFKDCFTDEDIDELRKLWTWVHSKTQ